MTIDSQPVWAEWRVVHGGVRVRIDTGDFWPLGLSVGRRVRVGLPDRPEVHLVVAEAVPLDPACWLAFSEPLRSRDRVAGPA